VIICIRRDKEATGSPFASLDDDNFRGLLFRVASRHGVTLFRRFGEVWLGSVGFFTSFETDFDNCQRAIEFAREVCLLQSSISCRLTVALELGNLVGGFLDVPCFDVFGHEMRWVLMMAELNLFEKIILGESIRKKVGSRRAATSSSPALEIIVKTVFPPWDAVSALRIHYIAADSSQEGSAGLMVTLQRFMRGHGLRYTTGDDEAPDIVCCVLTNLFRTPNHLYDSLFEPGNEDKQVYSGGTAAALRRRGCWKPVARVSRD
jgi:hypothetical protein